MLPGREAFWRKARAMLEVGFEGHKEVFPKPPRKEKKRTCSGMVAIKQVDSFCPVCLEHGI